MEARPLAVATGRCSTLPQTQARRFRTQQESGRSRPVRRDPFHDTPGASSETVGSLSRGSAATETPEVVRGFRPRIHLLKWYREMQWRSFREIAPAAAIDKPGAQMSQNSFHAFFPLHRFHNV